MNKFLFLSFIPSLILSCDPNFNSSYLEGTYENNFVKEIRSSAYEMTENAKEKVNSFAIKWNLKLFDSSLKKGKEVAKAINNSANLVTSVSKFATDIRDVAEFLCLVEKNLEIVTKAMKYFNKCIEAQKNVSTEIDSVKNSIKTFVNATDFIKNKSNQSSNLHEYTRNKISDNADNLIKSFNNLL